MLQIRLVIFHLAERSLGHRSKHSTQDLSDHSWAVPSERRIQTEQGMNQQSQLKNPPQKKDPPGSQRVAGVGLSAARETPVTLPYDARFPNSLVPWFRSYLASTTATQRRPANQPTVCVSCQLHTAAKCAAPESAIFIRCHHQSGRIRSCLVFSRPCRSRHRLERKETRRIHVFT